MATIPDLVNTLEGTATSSVVAAGNIDGVFGAAPIYSATAVQGNTSIEFSQTNNNSSLSFDLTSTRATIYLDFYLQVVAVPNDAFPLVNWTSPAGATKGGDVRIVGNGTTFNFQIRKGVANTAVHSTTWNLPVGQYRVQIKMNPNSATGYRVQVWSTSPLNGATPNYDTGDRDATSSGITGIGRVNVGIIAATPAVTQTTIRIDDILADDANPVVRAASSTTSAFYRKNGSWITYEHFYRKSNSWDTTPPATVPDPVSTLSVTSGSVGQTSVALTWTVVADTSVQKYGIFRGQTLIKDTIDPGATGTTVTGLTAGTQYILDVRRANSVGWSLASPTVTFTTSPASTFIFNPAMGVSDGNNYHGGATSANNDWDAWRSYNYSNAKTKANLPGTSKPRVIGVTGNTSSQGAIWTDRTAAYNYWVGNLEDFYYGTGSAERKTVELHIGNGNEYGDKVRENQTALDNFVAGCQGIYEATRRLNTDGTRRYPLASAWIDPTHEQENQRDNLNDNGNACWSVAITAAAAAPYLDGIAWSMYPPGRKYEINNIPQVGDPQYNWPSFVEADRWTGNLGFLYRCFKRTKEAGDSAGKTLKIAVWEFGIGDDPDDVTTRPYYATHLVGSMGRLSQQFGLPMTEIIWWDQQKNETSTDVGPHPQNLLSAGPGVQIRRQVNGVWITSNILPNDAANASIGSAGGYAEGALGERTSANPTTTQALKNWRTYNEYYGGTNPSPAWDGNPKVGWNDTNLSTWQSSWSGFVPPAAS
jgi:hypothetical protein